MGGTGGAGGGAIRILSPSQILVTGSISANGGASGVVLNGGFGGGAGAGGAIHLIAPTISGNGYSFNTSTNSFTGSHTNTLNSGFYVGLLYNVPANNNSSVPTLSITQINGIAVPASPTGSYTAPDVSINSANAVTVNIAAANIPVGTVVVLRVIGETDTLINCNPPGGASAATTTATCGATYPYSVSISSIRATW